MIQRNMAQVITSNEYIKTNGEKFDFLRLILVALVAGIHLSHTGFIARPVFRIAVPLFFIISSYLFFLRQHSLTSHENRKQSLIRYVKRILKLYLFWFIVLLPVTIDCRGWTTNVNIYTVIDIVRGFLFGSTFKASWFLMASVIGVTIVWYLAERKVKDAWIIALGIVAYVVCCLVSNYHGLCEKIPYFTKMYRGYCFWFTEPYNSFPVAILFVAIGKVLAQHKFHIPQGTLKVAIGVLLLCLYGEYFLTTHYELVIKDDCFFSLPPLSLCLFMLIGQNRPRHIGLDTLTMRSLSVIIYCCHNSIAYVLAQQFRSIGIKIDSGLELFVLYLLTMATASLLGYIILKLEKRKPFGLLKYSH